jgi:magnesium chelatase family protein
MLDRIDIHISVPRVDYEKLSDKRTGESSGAIRKRVEATRECQRQRFAGINDVSSNADRRPAEVRKFCDLDSTCTSLMKTAMTQLSACACRRMLKLSRTIADQVRSDKIGPNHLAEALQYWPGMNKN